MRELVAVEFDVPDLQAGTDEHLQFLADNNEQGLTEHAADRGVLVPVLIGQLAPEPACMTYEHPSPGWSS